MENYNDIREENHAVQRDQEILVINKL